MLVGMPLTKPRPFLPLLLLTAAAALLVPGVAFAQAGMLDPSFGGDGKVVTDFTRSFDDASGLAIQSDQKLIAAGGVGGKGGRFGLARYNVDGTLDSTFGGDGRITTNFTAGFDGALDVALQADGKIIAVGVADGGRRFALARYETDGSLDATFGGDGKVVTDFSVGRDFALGVVIQTDQKIVVAGRVGSGGGRMGLARYNTGGALDFTFSGDGKKGINFTRHDDRADLVALQADGSLVAAGTAAYDRRTARFAVVRLTSGGTLDTSFSGDGKVTTNFTDSFDGAFAVAIQSDQKIVVAGQAASAMGLARYTSGGTLDPAFGDNGKVQTNFGGGVDYADDIELDAAGNIVAAGSANFFGNSNFALARFMSDGTLDSTFGGDGRVTTSFTSGADHAFNVAIQADGNVVAVGRAAGSKARFALARYFGT